VQELIHERVILRTGIALDSCPIEAPVKVNNQKASVKDRYNKNRIPSGDKVARLGVNVRFLEPFKKKVHYFWGYRNHIINDLVSELPLVEITLQANKSEKSVALTAHRMGCEKKIRFVKSFVLNRLIQRANILATKKMSFGKPYSCSRFQIPCSWLIPLRVEEIYSQIVFNSPFEFDALPPPDPIQGY
jgi:hypothetical protein